MTLLRFATTRRDYENFYTTEYHRRPNLLVLYRTNNFSSLQRDSARRISTRLNRCLATAINNPAV